MNKIFKKLLREEYFTYFNFIRHNKKKFSSTKIDNINNGEILIEYNAFHSFHIPISYFSNYLKKLLNAEINAFFNYSIMSAPLHPSLVQKVKWFIGNFFSLKNFGIYRSFGTKKIVKPKITLNQRQRASVKLIEINQKIISKNDILDIQIDGIKIGDLVYDTYLKSQMKPTVDIRDEKFKEILFDFCKLYYFWKDYFNSNNVKSVVGVHTAYSFGLPLRIAVHSDITTYAVGMRKINLISKKMPYYGGEHINFPEMFEKIKPDVKDKGIEQSKKKIQDRMNGIAGVEVDLISSEISSFHKNFSQNKIIQNNKIKILIAPHDFFDAVHGQGNILFSDFYEWINFLGKMSEITDYDWYIKNRPNYPGKFKRYQPYTTKVINQFLQKFKKIKELPSNYSHHQIIKEKINFVFTCFGTVGTEYALFDIPVVNASINNPHHRYSFNFNPRTINELEKIILDLPSLKLKIDKSEIYEHYFLKNIYLTKNWLIDDLKSLIEFVDGWSGQNSFKLYQYWMMIFNEERHKKVFNSIDNFVKSKEDAITIDHLES